MIIEYFIGTYTWHDAEGIYRGVLDTASGQFELEGLAIAAESPAFLAGSDRFVYAVNESRNGGVTAYARDGDTLAEINRVSSGGSLPCHLDVIGDTVVVANYGSGNTAAFPIRADGAIGDCTSRIFHPGSGPNPTRQTRAHAHQVFPIADDTLWVPDLGGDQIFEYRLANHRLLDRRTALALPAGSGPRHLAATEEHLYVLGELGNTIDVVDRTRGSIVQNVTTLPTGHEGASYTAEIIVGQTGTLLATNRGDNSIVTFAIASDGTLHEPSFVPTLGDHPRFMTLDPSESFLLVLNQNDDNIVVYAMEDGRPREVTCNIGVPTPVCLLAI